MCEDLIVNEERAFILVPSHSPELNSSHLVVSNELLRLVAILSVTYFDWMDQWLFCGPVVVLSGWLCQKWNRYTPSQSADIVYVSW